MVKIKVKLKEILHLNTLEFVTIARDLYIIEKLRPLNIIHHIMMYIILKVEIHGVSVSLKIINWYLPNIIKIKSMLQEFAIYILLIILKMIYMILILIGLKMKLMSGKLT